MINRNRPTWSLQAPWPLPGWHQPARRKEYRNLFWQAMTEQSNPDGWSYLYPRHRLSLTLLAYPPNGRQANYWSQALEAVADSLKHLDIIRDQRQVQHIHLERRSPGSPAFLQLELCELLDQPDPG